MILADKRLLITGVITKDSIAFHAAEQAQREGAEVLLTSFGRVRRMTERAAARLPKPVDVLELDVNSPADLGGRYSAVTAGITIIEGGSVAYLKNDKGVVIKLHSQTGGVRFNLSANGMHVTLKQS